jgi:hypothetical protein
MLHGCSSISNGTLARLSSWEVSTKWRAGPAGSTAGRPRSILPTGSAAQSVQYVARDTVDGGIRLLPNDHGPVGGGRSEDRPVAGVDAHRRCPPSGDIWLSGCAVPVTHPQVIDILVRGIEHHDAQNQKIFQGAVRAGGPGQPVLVVVESSAVALVSGAARLRVRPPGRRRDRRAVRCPRIPSGRRAAR